MFFCRGNPYGGWCGVLGIVSLWVSPEHLGRPYVVPMSPERAEKVLEALQSTLDNWYEAALEIADNADPATGNKKRGLHLAKAILQAKSSLDNLSKDRP